MALLVLIVMGATVGWLSSIITRSEGSAVIVRMIGAGVAGSLAAGLAVNGGTFLGGLTIAALGAGLVGAIAAAALAYWFLQKRVEA